MTAFHVKYILTLQSTSPCIEKVELGINKFILFFLVHSFIVWEKLKKI